MCIANHVNPSQSYGDVVSVHSVTCHLTHQKVAHLNPSQTGVVGNLPHLENSFHLHIVIM